MLYRKFGNTDLNVSETGFGAWAIGGAAMVGKTAIGWGTSDDKQSVKAIHAALDAGINFFDTADIYGLGHSEKLLGKAIGNKNDIIIASKGGNVARDEKFTTDYSKEHIINACEQSLKRLQRECIDYYQLHSARLAHLQQGDCIEAMQLLQQQGKIKYWGLSLNSFAPLTEARYLMKEGLGNGFQLVLNVLNQRALPVLKEANEKGFGIIARMPLQFGLLTGKFDHEFSFSDTDHRKGRINRELVNLCATALQPVWALCKKYHCNKTTLALSYIMSYNAVTTVIPGMRNEKQVKENCSGFIQLSAEDTGMIAEKYHTHFISIMNEMERLG